MRIKRSLSFNNVSVFILCLIVLVSCRNKNRFPGDKIAATPQEMQQIAPDFIKKYLDSVIGKKMTLNQPSLVQKIYEKNNYKPAWSKEQEWLPLGDSLYHLISGAQMLGLFPEDYHEKDLAEIRNFFFNDSAAKGDRKDASYWSKADVLLTDALLQIIKDVRLGRLPQDSITLRKDSVLSDEFFQEQFNTLQQTGLLAQLIRALEPHHGGYYFLKAGIKRFLDSADNRQFTVVPSPKANSVDYKKALQKRLYEGGFLVTDSLIADSATITAAIKGFQLKNGITVDGKVGPGTLRMLNFSDREKFIRIAITMDKYKMLPEKMPLQYIWVNLPAYSLKLFYNDSVKISSRIICGKPITKTPQLTSAISEIITYPQWTIPTSIIVKEILPAVKKNPGYLQKKGFSLLDRKGDEVDPFSVDWTKYNKGIPYRVVQGSGDANALGVLKFNFSNIYSVYLHDTNQRYLFGLTSRDLSHGCVRVQEWYRLANYIVRNDYLNSGQSTSKEDSLETWLRKKQKHSIFIRNRIPLFIRYFTCEGNKGGIIFYDDIYGEDKWIRQNYFTNK